MRTDASPSVRRISAITSCEDRAGGDGRTGWGLGWGDDEMWKEEFASGYGMEARQGERDANGILLQEGQDRW